MSILVSSGAISRRAARAVRHERMSIPRVNQYQRTRLLKVQAHHSVECCPVTDTPRTCACFARLQRPERCPPPRSSRDGRATATPTAESCTRKAAARDACGVGPASLITRAFSLRTKILRCHVSSNGQLASPRF